MAQHEPGSLSFPFYILFDAHSSLFGLLTLLSTLRSSVHSSLVVTLYDRRCPPCIPRGCLHCFGRAFLSALALGNP